MASALNGLCCGNEDGTVADDDDGVNGDGSGAGVAADGRTHPE